MILNLEYSEIYKTLFSFCDECENSLFLYYTNILPEIAWSGRLEKLKILENLASKLLKGKDGENMSITDIYKENVFQKYQISILLLLCKLGLDKNMAN